MIVLKAASEAATNDVVMTDILVWLLGLTTAHRLFSGTNDSVHTATDDAQIANNDAVDDGIARA